MDIIVKLDPKYTRLGFSISQLSEDSFTLKYHDKDFFVFKTELPIRDDFFDRLCEEFLKSLQPD